jgi:hypothetical protein
VKWRVARSIGIGSLLAVLLAAAAFASVGPLTRRVHRDLRDDITWGNVAFDAPVEKTTRAYAWYPLTYPVLETWSFGNDYSRAQYAERTILHFGGALARHWLDTAIERDPVDAGDLLPGPYGDEYERFQSVMDLHDPAVRQRLAFAAVRHLGSEPNDPQHFDGAFLSSLGVDALPALEAFARTATPAQVTRLSSVLPYGEEADDDTRARIARLKRLAETAYREQSPSVPEVVASESPRVTAISNAILALNAGDKSGIPVLRPLVDGDLRELNSNFGSETLLAVADAFPESRFTRGCRDYDAIRGGTYFSRDDFYHADLPKASADEWRTWLATYPDHPGADDATYWLGRTLQHDGQRLDAAWVYADGVERHVGDGDVRYDLWVRFRYMLDVGLTEEDLAAFERRHPTSRFAPFVRYARAVRRARAGDFRTALALADSSHLEDALRRLKDDDFVYDLPGTIDAYRAQRRLWRNLNTELAPNVARRSNAARDRLAAAWSDDDGWQIGYLVLFEGTRDGGAMPDNALDFEWAPLAGLAQAANQNAQTIALAEPLTAPSLPRGMRERNERRIVVALYTQQTDFPDPETDMMGPLTSLPPTPESVEPRVPTSKPFSKPGTAAYRAEVRANETESWWARQTAIEADRYVRDFPGEPFAATALLASYEVTGRTRYLREIVARYPNGERTEEARALLWAAAKSR